MPSLIAIARRIAAMSALEIRTRAKMAVRQRLDAIEASLGKHPLEACYREPSTAPARFFFETGEAALTAAVVMRRLPAESASVIESARRVQSGSFDLLGYRGLSLGDRDIDWHRDSVHGITAPNEVWFRVPYLDFGKTGDHKIIWELSRHQILMLLARAWLYTGEADFLATLERLWTGWRNANPYPMGINWASTLEVAFRCLSWIWVDRFSAAGPELTKSFRTGLREGIGESAVYIERYISTYFAPNTHLLGEALALFFVGVLYPGFERARVWREYGWRILIQESSRQVREDGFHFEQSVYYHVYALDMFIHARVLAARNGIEIPPSYDQVIIRMADGLAAIGAAGQAPRFGDDDGGRLFDGRRNGYEHLLDPLAAAAVIYGRADWKNAGGLREETIWLLGPAGMRTFDELPDVSPELRSRAFPASGYYTMAASRAVAIVDAGPHGWGRGGHGHADALSIQLIGEGRAWLTDPGTGTYPREKPERDLLRGTAAHNTLEIDGRSQAEPFHSFAWRSHPVTKVHCWYAEQGVAIFHGSHDGYRRLPMPVTHERWVISWPDDVWLVLDRARGQGPHLLDLRWHLSPDCVLSPGRDGNSWRATAEQQTLEIIVPPSSEWRATCEMGRLSPAYGELIASPVLHFSREGPLPADCATILSLNGAGEVSFRGGNVDGADVYVISVGESRRLVVLASAAGAWRCGSIESDAELLVIGSGDVLISGGNEVRIGGESVAMERKSGEVWAGVTSAASVTKAFDEISQAWGAL